MAPIGRQLILQFILIMVNAFFAMTETAVISLNPTMLRKMSMSSNKKMQKLLKMAHEPSNFLSTIQIGITLAGFLGSAFAADAFAGPLVSWLVNDLHVTALSVDALDTIAVILITLILSYFTLVFGELVPKRIAMQRPMQVAQFSCGAVTFVASIMRPVVWFLSFSTDTVLKLLHMKTIAEEDTVTEEEIRMMVDLGEERGVIETEEGRIIDNVLEFTDATVHEVMTHVTNVTAISANNTHEEIMEVLLDSGYSRLPVYGKDSDDVIGVLSARDYLLDCLQPTRKPLVELVRPAHFVPDGASASAVMHNMKSRRIHLAVVSDEFGVTCGIVTLEDLLEEIVGDIEDELDSDEPPEIEPVGDGVYLALGSTSIRTLEQTFNVELENYVDCDTLSGMVLGVLNEIPQKDALPTVTVHGLDVRVERMDGRRITQARIRKAGAPQAVDAAV